MLSKLLRPDNEHPLKVRNKIAIFRPHLLVIFRPHLGKHRALHAVLLQSELTKEISEKEKWFGVRSTIQFPFKSD